MDLVHAVILKVVYELQRTTILNSSSGLESIVRVRISVAFLPIAIAQMWQDGEMGGLSLSLG